MPDPLDRFRELFSLARPMPPGEGFGGDREPDTPRERAGRLGGAALALSVAFVLWFTFSMRETYTVAVDVPLVVSRLPAGSALRERPPATARFQLQGEGWSLLTLSRNPPPVELRADGEAISLLQAANESTRLPAGVAVLGAQPATVTLVLEEQVERTVPIVLSSMPETPAPYGLLRPPVLRPDSVQVTGARSVLADLTAWPTAPLEATTLRRTHVEAVALLDTLAGLVSRSLDRTTVTFEVEQFTEGARLLDVRVRNVPPGVSAVRLLPARVRATYLVPVTADFYDRAAEDPAFFAEVDYADIARDTTLGTVPVRPRVPPGLPVRQIRLTPARLEYFTVRE